MLPEKMAKIKMTGLPATQMTEISSRLYAEFIVCTLEITDKLDLCTFKEGEAGPDNADGAADDAELATSDPVSGLRAKTPKDFQVYMNLISMVEEVLPLQCQEQLEPHTAHLFWYFIRRSSLQPLVSAHYNAITTLLSCTKIMKYFESRKGAGVETVIHLLTSYVREVLHRCRQYRDHLLASCLTLVLRLPLCIVTDIFPQLIPPLQMALQLGVSYLPLAEVCVSALQQWTPQLPHHVLLHHLPSVLPLLLPYLHSLETGGEAELQTRVIEVKMSFANQRRKVDRKRILASKQMDATAMHKVQLSILHLIGSLDPSLSQHVIPQDPDSLAAAAVRWDVLKHVKFAVPFEHVKIDIFLDDLLPQVVDLALNSSDRQTKVAASELLHSIVILMIGTGASQHKDLQQKYPMAPLYHHVFRTMLRLACDPDQVTRQLFLTLTFQTIHWFTNNSKFENPDTAVLLEAIMEGIVTPNDPALRDVCAQCLAEFVKWSRKQSPQKDLTSRNLKSILKRIFSYCKHPSSFKRLGGCLAWNSIYREVREDEQAVNMWTVELLVHLVGALHLAHADDPALATHDQTKAAIQHVERIFKVKKELFWKKSSHRRVPGSMGDGTMEDVVLWLLQQCGTPKALVRHTCMELLVSLSPCVKGCSSVGNFIKQKLGQDVLCELVNIVEGGGEAGLGISSHPDPQHFTQAELKVKHVNLFCEALLAALDCYSWLISQGVVSAAELVASSDVKAFASAIYFIDKMSSTNIETYLNSVAGGDMGDVVVMPHEAEEATHVKCTVIVRLLDMVGVMLQDGPHTALLHHCPLLTQGFYELTIQCILDPNSVGFDLKDTEVIKHLPARLEEVLGIMKKKFLPVNMQEFTQCLENHLQKSENNITQILPASLSASTAITHRSQHVIEGITILQKTGWLALCSSTSKQLSHELADWVCNSLFMKVDHDVVAVSPLPSHLHFICAVMKLALALDSQVLTQFLQRTSSSDAVRGASDQKIEKGSHILSVLGPQLMPHFIDCCDHVMLHFLHLVRDGHFLTFVSLATAMLNFTVRNTNLRKRHSVKVVQAFLYHWGTLCGAAEKSSLHQEAMLSILSSLFLVDREGTIKKHCQDLTAPILTFYQTFICCTKTELQLKIKALKILPFFLTMSDDISESVGKSLQIMSANHLPLKSTEFVAGSSKDREYHSTVKEILTALELSGSLQLLDFTMQLFCREDEHRYDELLRVTLGDFIKRLTPTKQEEVITFVFNKVNDQKENKPQLRYNMMEKVMVPLLQLASTTAVSAFLVQVIKPVMRGAALVIEGRDDEQFKDLVTKTASFGILQIMYSRFPPDCVFSPASEISLAYKPSDESGKELTKEVIRYASKVSKGELRHNKTHEELRRLCACAAYSTIIALLACVQKDQKFYTNFLFAFNPLKGESIWESLIDCNKTLNFDVEVNFKPASKSRFVAVRRKLHETHGNSGAVHAGTVQYLASHYLSDSSLREDITQFDFSNSVVLVMSQQDDPQHRSVSVSADDGELLKLNLDQNDYNGHEVMANLTAVIYHMLEAEILVLHKEERMPTAAEVPQWMMLVQKTLESGETPRNVKLFLLRLMMNTSQVFAPYAAHFVNTVLTCLVDGTLGKEINYFLCDVMVMLLGWGKKGVPQDSITSRNIVGKVLCFLCSNTPHTRADVFKYNLDVVRCVVESWREVITVPYAEIYSLMETKYGKCREVEAGLQLLGIVLGNGFLHHTKDRLPEKIRCERLLLKFLTASHIAEYGAAAEIFGLILRTLSQEPDNSSALEDAVVKKIMAMDPRMQGQAVNCIHNIQKHYQPIIRRFIIKLQYLVPRLYGIYRTRALECMVSYASSLEDVFVSLKDQKLLDILSKKEASTQLVCLQLVNAVMPRLSPSEVLYFMPAVTTFAAHPAPKCREVMYGVLTSVYKTFSGSTSDEGKQLEATAKATLLRAVKDDDAALRQTVLNFWLESSQKLKLPERLLHIMQKMYSPESEDSFLHLAIYTLLEATRHSADYQRDIFPQPLTVCSFREMKVSTEWRARHASMIPLFAETQSSMDASLSSLVSLTQSSDADGDLAHVGGVQVTQANVFTATQQAGGTYNWVTGSTFDTSVVDMEYRATVAPTQGQGGGLMFTVGSSEKKDMTRYKRPSIGNSPLQAPEQDVPDVAGAGQTKLIRRRFVKNQDHEKQTIHFAKMEERRRKLRASRETERKQKREAQVTMHRQYRVGELPDIQIPHRAIIAPLQALAQRDTKVSGLLFEAMAQGVLSSAGTFMSREDEDTWLQQVHEAVKHMLNHSYMCHPETLRTVLHLVMNNNIHISPDTVASVCLESQLEALGILILERQLLVSRRDDVRSQPPPRKRARTSSPPDTAHDPTLWLSMAKLYKSLNMWDVVRGIIHQKLGDISEITREALQAEAKSNYVKAYQQYSTAIQTQEQIQPDTAEVRLWEERYAVCAGMLGRWQELEGFTENRFLQNESGETDLEAVWGQQAQRATILTSLVHSKLMLILDGAESDLNLIDFVDKSLAVPQRKPVLEGEMALQLAVLSTNQEKLAQAQYYTDLATSSMLLIMSQYSLLTPKPLTATLRNVQLLTELTDYLNIVKLTEMDYFPSKVKQVINAWKTQRVSRSDTPHLIQFLSSYRDLYLHLIQKQMPEDCSYNIPQLVKETRSSMHLSVIKTALHSGNYHLADRHLKKLKPLCEDDVSKCQFFFLMTEASIQRSIAVSSKALQYLVEPWAKFLGKVNEMPVLEQDPEIEIQYLLLESTICKEICNAIQEMGENWSEENIYMKTLKSKFPQANSKETWYDELLRCSYNSLQLAVKYTEEKLPRSDRQEDAQQPDRDTYMTLVKFCEDCLENWTEHINTGDYAKELVTSVLKAMAKGSRDAHFRFPQLINLMDDDASLIEVFAQESRNVPTWMFLLWLNHILIYVDKAPGKALQPIIEKVAAEYPQALVYPFRISMQNYDFTTEDGRAAEAMCHKVEEKLSQNNLLHQFVSAISLLTVPFVACREAIKDLILEKNKGTIEKGLQKISQTWLKVNSKSTRGLATEAGEAHTKMCRIRNMISTAFTTKFGGNLSKVKSMLVDQIHNILIDVIKSSKPTQDDEKKMHKQLKSYSPWLANFQASKHTEVIELPGQYSGMTKPLPEYHIKISSFDENLSLMSSQRFPMRIVIRGDDEKDHKFLVKAGEDLRTDQRMEQVFTLMNSIYSSSQVCDHTSLRPYLNTYQVVPLSLEVGIIEWVESSQPLRDFMNSSLKEDEKSHYYEAHILYKQNENWKISKKSKKNEVISKYSEAVNKLPWDTLRSGLVKLSSSSEGFFFLRTDFMVSYATLSISHWLLGIGDRHCDNSLVSLRTGRIIGIDFGHHFESAVQFIPVPELMPFRLTPQIANVFEPIGATGMLRDIMVAVLEALKDSQHMLLPVLDAFVKKPTKDWLKFVKRQAGSAEDAEVEMFSKDRIKLLKAKLGNFNPAGVTWWAVSRNKHVKENSDKEVSDRLNKIIFGKEGNSLRSQYDMTGLSTHQQVDVLLEQAADPNILGRTWIGWDPFY